MTSAANYKKMRNNTDTPASDATATAAVAIKGSFPNERDEDAAFIFRDESGTPFRFNKDKNNFKKHPFTKTVFSNVKPLFGMDNDLFKDKYNENADRSRPRLYGVESCQSSSVVWAKYALMGQPHMDVHKKEKEEEAAEENSGEIYKLMIPTFHGCAGKFFRGQPKQGFIDLLNALEGVRIATTPIPLASASTVLNRVLSGDGKVNLIWQGADMEQDETGSHAIAIYSAPGQEYYCFDNGIGCIKATTWMAAKKWLLWAGLQMDEGVQDVSQLKFSSNRKWVGVKCSLRT